MGGLVVVLPGVCHQEPDEVLVHDAFEPLQYGSLLLKVGLVVDLLGCEAVVHAGSFDSIYHSRFYSRGPSMILSLALF